VILVTVGGQMPFDRLVSAVDAWAGARGRTDVFAQIGPTDLRPKNIEWVHLMEPDEFRRRVIAADAIVAHAGMGSILTALEHGKTILVMPRRGDLLETRNDHQVATAERFSELGRVHVARDERELPERLDGLCDLRASAAISPFASPRLVAALRDFVHAGSPRDAGGSGGR
jgi:UDP-N-acetylglucosamine transferase subunit ALG13